MCGFFEVFEGWFLVVLKCICRVFWCIVMLLCSWPGGVDDKCPPGQNFKLSITMSLYAGLDKASTHSTTAKVMKWGAP